ncbi:MAG TPA: hypothetical protein VFH73_26790 [Polyangia bacterium]|jgi:hypothetical protein|nr:hypothetical protein [Polyangia bacterium]
MTIEVVPATLTVARESLEAACDDLDEAVQVLPDLKGDNVMASPALVALLLRVVAARRFVKDLEAIAAATTGAIGIDVTYDRLRPKTIN